MERQTPTPERHIKSIVHVGAVAIDYMRMGLALRYRRIAEAIDDATTVDFGDVDDEQP